MINNLKVVFFDMGNTLLHFHNVKSDDDKDRAGIKYLTSYLKQFNSEITFEEVKNSFFDKWNSIMPLRKLHNTEYPVENYLNKFLEKYDVVLNKEACIDAMDMFYKEYRDYVFIEDDVYNTLEVIKSRGYKIGVISNSCLYDEVMINCFKKIDIDKFIDSYTFSYYLKVSKPKEEIFKIALNKMNITPNEAIMIGDNLKSDVYPSKALGLNGVWFNKDNVVNDTEIKPDIEISKIHEILKYI